MRFTPHNACDLKKQKHSVHVLTLLFRVLQMRGSISPANPWDVMVDLFFYREPEEVKDEAEADDGAPYEPPTYGGAGGLPAPQSAPPGTAQLSVCRVQHSVVGCP
jgi:small subunit ribosomal protein SAe